MTGKLLKQVYNGESLDIHATETLFDAIFNGEISEVQLAALLIALKHKGETADEIAGAAKSMRKFVVKPELGTNTYFDTCGTGGDNTHSFNVSTAVAIILNAMGYNIAKHGNRSVSSKSGSADFLDALQIPITFEKDALRTYYAQHKFIFLFAPQFHPAMKYAVPVRKQLGVRTIFNVLGPITNPAGPTKQMIGVFSPQFLPEYAQAVARLGYERILLYSAENGMDEVSATHPTLIYDVRGSEITKYTLNPEEFFSAIELSSLPQNCTAEENAAIFMETIDSQIPSPLSKMLALNTALALEILEEKGELQQDYKTALDFIHSGEVLQRVQGLKKG